MSSETFRIVLTPADAEVVRAVICPSDKPEVLVAGSRGDGKTTIVLTGFILHAQIHASTCRHCGRLMRNLDIEPYLPLLVDHGKMTLHPPRPDALCPDAYKPFPLPVPWIGVMDYHTSHKDKTVLSMQEALWVGGWTFKDDARVATFRLEKKALVSMRLIGIEDRGAIDKVRVQTCGVWFEEAAPADSLVTSAGISDTAWAMARTSQRVPSYHHPAVLTENYPDEDHWTWMRWVVNQEPGTQYFRIPVGNHASEKDRREWKIALRNRPDLERRLLAGMPGSIRLGEPVTSEYREDRHWSPVAQEFAPGTLFMGWDAWFHPAVALATLTPMGQLRYHLAKRLDNADVGALAEEVVIPWLGAHGLRGRPIVHTIDVTAEGGDQSDKQMSAMRRILRLLPGEYRRVSNEPDQREAAIKEQLRRSLSTGAPAILVCGKDAWELHQALAGGWHKKRSGKVEKEGEKGRHSHVGDAASYLALAVFGTYHAVMDVGKWANQDAYTQAWGGAPEGTHSPSAAQSVMRKSGFDKVKWLEQYR